LGGTEGGRHPAPHSFLYLFAIYIIILRKKGLSYVKIKNELNLKSISKVRSVIDPKYQAKSTAITMRRYYKLKALGICPQCGHKNEQ